MAAAYFARWGGPINEGDDPYYKTYKFISGDFRNAHLRCAVDPAYRSDNTTDIAAIKQAVYDNGAAYISMHSCQST
jgi:C1A family cysteine protease